LPINGNVIIEDLKVIFILAGKGDNFMTETARDLEFPAWPLNEFSASVVGELNSRGLPAFAGFRASRSLCG
jgi:hypothetical protein